MPDQLRGGSQAAIPFLHRNCPVPNPGVYFGLISINTWVVSPMPTIVTLARLSSFS